MHASQIVESVGVIWPVLERLLQGVYCLVQSVLLGECDAEVVECLDVVGHDLQGTPKIKFGLGEIASRVTGEALVEPGFGFV